jgi:hypothetical protein
MEVLTLMVLLVSVGVGMLVLVPKQTLPFI